MNVLERFNALKTSVAPHVKIVAVSKTKPASMIQDLYSATGHRLYGENRAQEIIEKQKILPGDIEWHFIGHLQTNKIKFIAPYISLIQSVDSFKLLREINKEGARNKRIIPCLLQFHIASEESKYGFSIEEVEKMLNETSFHEFSNITLKGVMGMATYTSDRELIRNEFKTLYKYYETLKNEFFLNQPGFCEISMGMTDDYQIAIDEGSTIIRIGSGIFGGR